MSNNADSQDLLSVVATVHHDRIGQSAQIVLTTYVLPLCDQAQGAGGFRLPLNDGALCLAETLSSISASGVREVDRRTDLDIIAVSKNHQVSQNSPLPYQSKILLVVRLLLCSAELGIAIAVSRTSKKYHGSRHRPVVCQSPASERTLPTQFSRITHVAPFSEQLDGIGLDILGED